MAEAFSSVGKTLGRYRILDGIAVGGMAELYLARIVGAAPPGTHVVVKQLKTHLSAKREFVELFTKEARLAASLQHPNIGKVFEVGEHEGLSFFAMEYLHGHDARALFERTLREGKRVPLALALTIVGEAAAGLHHAHELRDDRRQPLHIVHRDLSPSNIIVTYDGHVKLLDFGLARTRDEADQRTNLVKGKAAYLSPEQCRGEVIDRRSDIFSLGVILYELTTGTRLFRNAGNDSNRTVMNRIVKGDVPLPSSVLEGYPRTLEDVVLQALAMDRDRRHPNARALRLDLEAVAKAEGLTLSRAPLGPFLEEMFGREAEPWLGLDEPLDDFDEEGPSPDEFDEEVSTTLYTGRVEDLKDAWTAEALHTEKRPPTHGAPNQGRASSMRIALPLQAEDSDVFENPLVAPEEDSVEVLIGHDSPPGRHKSQSEIKVAPEDRFPSTEVTPAPPAPPSALDSPARPSPVAPVVAGQQGLYDRAGSAAEPMRAITAEPMPRPASVPGIAGMATPDTPAVARTPTASTVHQATRSGTAHSWLVIALVAGLLIALIGWLFLF